MPLLVGAGPVVLSAVWIGLVEPGVDAAGPVVEGFAARGLALVEVGSGSLTQAARAAGMPYAGAAAPIDEDPSPLAIDLALAELEAEALQDGSALGVITPLPVSMTRLPDRQPGGQGPDHRAAQRASDRGRRPRGAAPRGRR